MKSLKFVGSIVREWSKHWAAYTILTVVVSQVINLVLLPFIQFLIALVLKINNLPYLSYTNIGTIVMHHQIAAFAFLQIFLLVFLLIYLQYAILIYGITSIYHGKKESFLVFLKQSMKSISHQSLLGWISFIFYMLLIVPFSNAAFSTQLLAKAKIPVFILDSVSTNIPMSIAIMFGGLFMIFLAIRLIRAVPITVLKNISFSQALKQSWQETKHTFWAYVLRVFWLSLLSSGISFVWVRGLILIQQGLDKTGIALVGGIITMSILELGLLVWQSFMTVLFFMLVLDPDIAGTTNSEIDPSAPSERKFRRTIRVITSIGILVVGVIIAIYNTTYMIGAYDSKPLLVAHRGVDDFNGVQNTIPVLEKTAKQHPDYVEMDVHETKDNQFVVIHDADLNTLAHINKTVRSMTLAQLQKTTVSENGFTAKIPSFDDYLATAEKIDQPLIVELKITDKDSKDVIGLFLQKYANRLIKDKYPMHSLSYKAVTQAIKDYPKLFVSYITPYNLAFPETSANAYTAEQSTLDTEFMNDANDANKRVWAWTIDDQDDMKTMLFIGVDGIITDNLDLLQQTVDEAYNHPTYAQRLEHFADDMMLIARHNNVEN